MNTTTKAVASPEPTRNGDPTTTEKPAPAPSTAMVVRSQDDSFRMALEPTGFKEAQGLAAMVAKIQLCGVTSAEDAMVRIMTGRALGLPTFAALRSVYVIEGRPALEAKLKVALAMRHPDCEYIQCIETSKSVATYVAKRRGRPEMKLSFTIEEARDAGLIDRGNTPESKKMNNWNRYPAAMLRARASSQIVDIVFPDAMLGLPAREDVEDEYDRNEELVGEVVHPAPVQPPPQAAPTRNFEYEMEALSLRISEAIHSKSREQVKIVRAEMDKFIAEAGEPWASAVRDHYNRRLELAKAPAAPAQAQPPKADELPFK